jgi:hypothetical protein
MRMRVLLVVLMSAVATQAIATESVLIQRYQAMFENSVYSALCVVPLSASKPERVRFVCHYAIPNQPRMRDDTDGGNKPPVIPPDMDMNFNVWLSQGMTPPAKCEIWSALRVAFPQLPTDEALLEKCPNAKIATEPLNTANAANFIADVRSAIAAKLPAEPVKPAAPAVQKAPPSVPPTVVNTQTANTAPVTPASVTAAPPVTTTLPPGVSQPPSQPIDQPPATDTNPAPPPTTTLEAPDLVKWATIGLLVLTALGVLLLVIDRVWQIVRQRKLLDATLANDLDVSKALTLEEAAILLEKQRNLARQQFEAAKKERDDAKATLAAIDKHAGIAPGGDRGNYIAALAKSENSLLQLTGAVTGVSALNTVEAALKERKEIDQLLCERTQSDGPVQYVRECVALINAFSRPFWSNANSPVSAHRVVEDIANQLHWLYAGSAPDRSVEEAASFEIAALEETLCKQKDQIKNLEAARQFVVSEWSEAPTIPQLKSRMQSARAAASKVGCTAQDVDAIITELATKFEHERDVSHAAHEILRLLRDYLVLPGISGPELQVLLGSELGQPHRVLRLVLAAAVPELRRHFAAVSDEDASVVRMLRLPDIVDQLDAFLVRLSSYEGMRLWDGIYSAFGGIWLHNFFRAEAVLRTYFMASRLAELGDVLTLVAWAFRHAIATLGFDVDRVQLLVAPPAAMDPKHESPREFRTCPDIRSRVQTVLKVHGDGGFAIDVDSVGIREGNKVLKRGSVVLAKRIDWED